ncbi:murein transglycosylase A [Ralstonia pseudosolanacearum]|uniref:murein transglycosylase A n=1 Tax=Ralstonia pseudosolanacearum TaxID=1310165 RepID=UPI00186908AD|nr:murein transglycosylase A [Ralstonia pseudosolanacearum]QOK90567.1 murein transglycosylase A [Ralstonia pseudosolanacearum]
MTATTLDASTRAHTVHRRGWAGLSAALVAALLAACTSGPPPRLETPQAPTATLGGSLQPATWADVAGWTTDDLASAWPALQSNCLAMKRRADWARVCAAGLMVDAGDPIAMRTFFEDNFTPYRVVKDDGTDSGLITGYYEPLLRGSRTRHGVYQTPLYRMPAAWRGKTLPARVQLVRNSALAGNEVVWVDDPVEAAFLQIQGSGQVQLEEGGIMRLGVGGTNNQPFRSFARWLLDQGEITPVQATMQGIKAWARANPSRVDEMLNINPRYVFFNENPGNSDGPIGKLGVPLTAERSIAVDPGYIPLGAPVFLSTTKPLSTEPIQKLVFAQDVGSAIRGAVRADYYFGHGDAAGDLAGRMKQAGRLWVLVPKGSPVGVASR